MKFLSSHTRLNRFVPAVGLIRNGSMITAYNRYGTFPFRENRSPWSSVNDTISALSATNVLRNPACSCLAITVRHADLHSTSFPCFVRPFPRNRLHNLLVFPHRRSAGSWTPYIILRLTGSHKLSPLTNSKGMSPLANFSASWLIRTSGESLISSKTGPRATWPIVGVAFQGKNA